MDTELAPWAACSATGSCAAEVLQRLGHAAVSSRLPLALLNTSKDLWQSGFSPQCDTSTVPGVPSSAQRAAAVPPGARGHQPPAQRSRN